MEVLRQTPTAQEKLSSANRCIHRRVLLELGSHSRVLLLKQARQCPTHTLIPPVPRWLVLFPARERNPADLQPVLLTVRRLRLMVDRPRRMVRQDKLLLVDRPDKLHPSSSGT